MTRAEASLAWESWVSGERRGLVQTIARLLLGAIGRFYSGVMRLRNAAYDAGIFPSKKMGLPVISVGNLTLGGTGKTSLVLWIAQAVRSQNRSVAILSRGYRRKMEDGRSQIVSDGRKILAGAESAGDEPLMMARHCPDVPVIVGASRVQSALLAIREFGPSALLLDDAFQHRRIRRDLNLVCLDESILRAPKVFPAGFLREPASGLKRASGLVVQTERAAHEYMKDFESAFGFRWKGPAAFYRYAASEAVDHRTKAVYDPATLRGQALISASAIARPENFEKMISGLGGRLVGAKRFADHHYFETHELVGLQREAERFQARIVVTAKDAVKLPPNFAALVLNIRMEWTQGEEELKAMILDVVG